ncbi:MAG TPA: HEAT repeat domain-containing protein, partial [Planctomycetota bacterium]|nr:HEAT repeat domain-containing protein [Planctomycetota bacterium]
FGAVKNTPERWEEWWTDNQAALRESFAKDFQATEASGRVAAVKTLAGAKEETTVKLLAGALKDSSLEVRKAAAETLEASTDGAGVAIKPLGDILADKKEDLELRLACGKALSKSRYKGEAFPFFFKTISEVQPEEKHLHKFGYQVTVLLDGYIGKSFGAVKNTPERWEEWWTDNQAALKKDDEKKRGEWKLEGK